MTKPLSTDWRLTVRIPKELYGELIALRRLHQPLNDVIVTALEGFVAMCERDRIDREFSQMAVDADYQSEAVRIAGELP